MEVQIAFAGVPVSRLAPGRDFFERLLGRAADVVVAEDEVMWRLAESAWLYVVVDGARAGKGLVALSVDDLDATLATLVERGINPAAVDVVGDGARKASLLDPDGNSVAIIEVSR